MMARIALLTASNLRAAVRRPAAMATLLLGAAAVVGVTTSMAALGRGLYLQFSDAGSADRALVLERGAERIGGRALTEAHVEFVHQAAGAAAAVGADRIAHTFARLVGKGGGVPEMVAVQGITPEGLRMRSHIRMTRGRMFEAGRHEAVAGAHATEVFRGAQVGDRLALSHTTLDIVGTFESGDQLDSVFLVDAETVFGKWCTAMLVDLESPASFDDFRAALEGHSTLEFGVHRELEYLEALAWTRTEVFRDVGLALGLLMAIGGIFCATNVMVSAVARRRAELATLRALGFGRTDLAVAIVFETLAIVAVGAAVGAMASWMLLDGVLVREGGSTSTSFHPMYDRWALGHGIAWPVALMTSAGLFAVKRVLGRPIHHDLAAAQR
ncbi:MAG: ABC transporter permease [Gammaproteobacteria bacterium]|nr:ABC transporter permease [Gammaproteobacteria bacterium]